MWMAIDTSYNMNKIQNHQAELKKPDTKDYILYDSIYINFQRTHDCKNQSTSVITYGWGQGLTENPKEETLGK